MLSLCLLTLHLVVVPLGWLQLPIQRISGPQPIVDADGRELLRLTTPYGLPWLIFEPEEVQIRGNWHARVYLQPDAVDAAVRRGRLLLFNARTPPDQPPVKVWNVRLSTYAQVPAAAPVPLTSTAQDLPFVEWHRLPDADLLSLVAFIRSSPSAPERSNPGGVSHRINGGMPIQSIRRGEGSDVEVAVMRDHRDRSASWVLTVRQDGGSWRAVSVSFVIA